MAVNGTPGDGPPDGAAAGPSGPSYGAASGAASGSASGPASGAPAESLIVYPSDFPIKVMGPAAPGFVPAVVAVVQRHAPDFDPATVETRSSREGKYTSLTATVTATSREQLDALYKDLCDHPMVVMVL